MQAGVAKQEARDVPKVIVTQIAGQDDGPFVRLHRKNPMNFVLILSLVSPNCACNYYELSRSPVHRILYANYIRTKLDACI
jgi:hypothetical protein